MKFSEAARVIDPARWQERAASVAGRLLDGCGRASLFAYRSEPQAELQVLLHERDDEGRLVVAVVGAGEFGAGPVDVRLDIEKEAPQPGVGIKAASLHALGELTWLADAAVQSLVAEGSLTGVMAELSGFEGVRLARVELPRVLLHDCAGVTPLGPGDLTSSDFPGRAEEPAAVAILSAVQSPVWLDVISSVIAGHLAGRELSRRLLPSGCPSLKGRVHCVDVDAHGVTLMHITDEAATFFVPFDSVARDLRELRACVVKLASGVPAVVGQARATS